VEFMAGKKRGHSLKKRFQALTGVRSNAPSTYVSALLVTGLVRVFFVVAPRVVLPKGW
jgi:hypothetical protein